jgi:hypothetical protein
VFAGSVLWIIVALVLMLTVAGLLLALLFWGIRNPVAWMPLAALATAGGMGLTATGVVDLLVVATVEGPELDRSISGAPPAILVGVGSGLLAGGVVLLVISLWRWKRGPAKV